MTRHSIRVILLGLLTTCTGVYSAQTGKIIHDAEHYLLEAQHGKNWDTVFTSSWVKSVASHQDIDRDVEDQAIAFLDLLINGQYEKATAAFDATMKQVMPPKTLEQTWEQLEKQSGRYRQRTERSIRQTGAYRVVTITCKFENTDLDMIVSFDADSKLAGFSFRRAYQTPDYVDVSNFDEVTTSIGKDPWKLPALLTMPIGEGPFPAVVLVHGSGPQDRDESIGPNKPFRDLAYGLATRGVAVLRFDKRTFVHGKRIVQLGNTTVQEESVEDAIMAVQLLRDNPKVDSTRVHVLGHSWGGYLLPRIIQQDSEHQIASAIVFAGNTRSLAELMEAQTPYLLSVDGSISDADEKQISSVNELARKLRNLDQLNSLADGEMLAGAPKTYYLDLHEYKPEQLASKVFQKALFLQGERDYQVTMEEDFSTWKSKLSNRSGIIFKSYPDLNHLFMTGTGRSKPSEYQIPGNVARTVIDDLTKWVTNQR